MSTNGVGAISKYANPVSNELPAGVPVAFPAPSWYAFTTCTLSFQPKIISAFCSLLSVSTSVIGEVIATSVSPAVPPNVSVELNAVTVDTVVAVALTVIALVVNGVPFQSVMYKVCVPVIVSAALPDALP